MRTFATHLSHWIYPCETRKRGGASQDTSTKTQAPRRPLVSGEPSPQRSGRPADETPVRRKARAWRRMSGRGGTLALMNSNPVVRIVAAAGTTAHRSDLHVGI